MPRSRAVLASPLLVLALGACSDDGPTDPNGGTIPAAIQAQIDALFPAGTPRASATDQVEDILGAADAGRAGEAQSRYFDFVAFGSDEAAAGALLDPNGAAPPTTDAALATLMDVLPAESGLPVFVASQEVLNDIAGFNIHRGCLALGVRPPPIPLSDLVHEPSPERNPALRLYTQVVSRAVVLERVSNVDNVGGIFRSVAALGELFDFYLQQPQRLPPFHAQQAQTQPRHRVVCDYIAGMTDHFLLRQHRELVGSAGSQPARVEPGRI